MNRLATGYGVYKKDVMPVTTGIQKSILDSLFRGNYNVEAPFCRLTSGASWNLTGRD
jgi:hypothetical protein